MADKIPKYVQDTIGSIKTRLGICVCCTHLREPTENDKGERWFIAVCEKTGLQCYASRSSLVTCDHFSPKKNKSASNSFKDLLKAILKSLRGNDWQPLKDAINNELQD